MVCAYDKLVTDGYPLLQGDLGPLLLSILSDLDGSFESFLRRICPSDIRSLVVGSNGCLNLSGHLGCGGCLAVCQIQQHTTR